MKFGAIDIGTNAARLLIGEVLSEGGVRFLNKISYTRIPLRLGESVFDNGKINKKKAKQFVKTLQAFKLIAELYEVKKIRACATSAMREAKNGLKIKSMLLEKTGIDVDIISGDEEARLIFGTFELLNIDKSKHFVVVDVGGGSTEISFFNNGKRELSKSFDIGTLRMLKLKTHTGIWDEIYQWLDEHILDLNKLDFYATGGNINKAQKILACMPNKAFEVSKIVNLKEKLEKLTVLQRMEQYQLKPDRADVIVPALEIYCNILKHLNCNEIIVPKLGLSDGIIFDFFKKKARR